MTTSNTPSTETRQVEVLLPLNVTHGFDYLVKNDSPLALGTFVSVPFGRGDMLGIIWKLDSQNVPPHKCKPIKTIHDDVLPLNQTMLNYLQWVAWYNCQSLGLVLKLALPVTEAITSPSEQTVYQLTDTIPKNFKITPARQRVLEYLDNFPGISAPEIILETGVSRAVLNGLEKAGAINKVSIILEAPKAPLNKMRPPKLTDKQSSAAKTLLENTKKGFAVSVLEGLTGSGKTEVYFDTIERILTQEKQVLVLLPEIALSMQWITRFKKRFGFAPHIWHSAISKGEKKKTWRDISQGNARLVVGARSALFLPFHNIGLVIVDEEHEPSYKQEDTIIYHARDMAVAKAKHENIPIILVSATPSLETRHNWQEGRYKHVHLDTRYGEATIPETSLIDMRQEKLPASEFLSKTLCQSINQTVAEGKQALLFLNRRGYAPLTLCRSCGHRLECPHCTSWLVLHRHKKRLECHHCGFTAPMIDTCPECNSKDTLTACGPGVERIEEEVLNKFPEARVLTLTSDSGYSKEQLASIFSDITKGNIDIIIGTQLLAKGHHFPLITLVGIVDADMGLGGADLRATERCYQLLHQLSGRAGREKHPGRVLIQTYQPEHPVMKTLGEGDSERFLALETQARKEASMPPFGRLAALILEGKNESQTKNTAANLAKTIPAWQGIQVLGPAQAPLYKLRDYYRYRFLIHAKKEIALQKYLHDWLNNISLPSTIKCKLDIDPQSFL